MQIQPEEEEEEEEEGKKKKKKMKMKKSNSGNSYFPFNPFPIVKMGQFFVTVWWYDHNDVNRSSNDRWLNVKKTIS